VPPPDPVVEALGPGLVVRDDLLPGGTKVRGLAALGVPGPGEEWCYASPSWGHAQLALALAGAAAGARVRIFVPERRDLSAPTRAARDAGARLVLVPAGRLSVVQARARDYCALTGATLAPFGLAVPGMEAALAVVAAGVAARHPNPPQVWVAAGSGMLARALARAWPAAELVAVVVGAEPRLPAGARAIRSPTGFEAVAPEPPPIPSAGNYDAKVWAPWHRQAAEGALWWNVAA
jgi:hypothetical protein